MGMLERIWCEVKVSINASGFIPGKLDGYEDW